MFIELHLIQNFAPSNLNRDDTNNPKDCEFGGVRRARVSSQCIKRSIRQHPVFAATTAVPVGIRTRYMTRLLAKALTEAGKPAEDAQTVAGAFAARYSKMDKSKKDRTSVLIYLSQAEVGAIAERLLADWDSCAREARAGAQETEGETAGETAAISRIAKDIFKATQNRAGAPDIALFGRMMAENPKLSLDAACQVAHAISTHRVNMEMDFYTAVDDWLEDDSSEDEESGAGMMGITGFNSACFYRYARIDWEQLLKNLEGNIDLARCTVEAFLRASILAIPSGKQNSFAAQNPPDFLLAVARKDGQSWSLANAFEDPVYHGKNGLVHASIEAFDSYWGKLAGAYGNGSMQLAALSLHPDIPLKNLETARLENFDACVSAVLAALPRE